MKKLTLIFEMDDNGNLNCSSDNCGFNVLEMIGLLRWKEKDLMDHINTSHPVAEITEDVKEEPAKSGIWYVTRDPVECETKIRCSVCGHAQRSYGPFVSYPVNCPDCGSFMTAEVEV